ncbi:Rrf2 family transcriptional regulator [Streptomyces sp. 130]|uniref:RrF2 family transcriptional regulator n=1 Tax=Streptomyces sp. 130 TaxID=2591006 RepID=UPI00117F54E5|nr:Rrf2 family transcriptional regulator [Streptomyces sp. 130]TRV77287.1 Rrf2 family transcriptional regulator [Streptomyces sp. 130]
MNMGEGVEWGLHCCLALAWVGEETPVPAAKLAAWFDLPQAYLSKCLQALVRADILGSTPGVRGGYRLARPPERITLMDVVTAIEGRESVFRCTEIRQRGESAAAPAGEFRRSCGVAVAMRRAELAWRRELTAQTVADLMATAPAKSPERARRHFAATGS